MLWDKTTYTADISYLTNVFIYEYDISKANINILFSKNLIDKSTYEFLYGAQRMVRQVYIGKLCRDKSISDALKSGIIEAKKYFFEANGIEDRDVLSIKNDAVFLINKRPQITKFGLINFMEKNKYTSFFKLGNMEYYYYYNNITKDEYIDIKGISDESLKLHEQYMLQLIKDIFYSIQINGPEISMRMLKDAYMEYIQLKLPVGFYRNFNSDSMYHFKFQSPTGTGYIFDNINENQKNIIDISYNLIIFAELQRIITAIFFNKMRG